MFVCANTYAHSTKRGTDLGMLVVPFVQTIHPLCTYIQPLKASIQHTKVDKYLSTYFNKLSPCHLLGLHKNFSHTRVPQNGVKQDVKY